MARYDVHAMLVSLNVTDTPVFYNTPFGPSADFTVTYNQREIKDFTTYDFANFGNQWTCNLISYIIDNSSYLPADAKLYVQGGGVHTFTGFNSGTNSYAPEYRTQAVLVRTSTSPISYELRNPDGSKQIFSVPNSTVGPGRKVFLTQTIDPMGNTLTFTYSGQRIVGVTDSIGQVTAIEYKSNTIGTTDYYKIGKVTNPFGKFATFSYNTANQLIGITDMIGITSSFEYGSGDFISKLTTPYGVTTFAYGDSATTVLGADATRWIEITDPVGAKERVEYRINAPGFSEYDIDPTPPDMPFPPGSYYLGFRNSFYWSKKAMMEAPGDYSKAKVIHWLHSAGGMVSGTVESEKEPFENRVYYLYKDQGYVVDEGPNELMTAKGRMLDDGTSQVYQYDYNAQGNKTMEIDPLGRTTNFVYDTNGIDLLEVNQKVGTGTEILAQNRTTGGASSYNAQHLPARSTDAAVQAMTYTYDGAGRVLTSSRVRNGSTETTARTYVTNPTANGYGNVKTITGPMTGATTTFAYDGFGRLQTVTDSVGYAVSYEYDALNRQTKILYPDSTYEQTIYTRLDPEWKRDRLGRWTHSFYDALQRVAAMQDPANRTTQYKWCLCGALDSIIDPNGNRTIFSYAVQKRMTHKKNADGSGLTFQYENGTSRLKRSIDAKNQVANYDYFADDNLKSVTYTDNSTPEGTLAGALLASTPPVSYTYDPNYNRLASRTDGTGATGYAYQPVTSGGTLGAGQLASVDGPLTNDTVSYTYDEYGRIAAWSVNGNVSTSTYDSLGRVVSVSNPLGIFTNSYVSTTNRLQEVDYPNGQSTVYDYYPLPADPRLKEINNMHGGGASVLSKFYCYSI